MLGVLAQDDVSLQGIHLSDEMVYDTRHCLLSVCSLLLRRLVSLFIQADDFVAVAHVIDRLFRGQESRLHTVVDILSLESDPIAFPSLGA